MTGLEFRYATKPGDRIYFIFAPAVNMVKIGFTRESVKVRFDALRTSSPVALVLLTTIPGSKSQEQELHQRFASVREHGEWFRREGELDTFVSGLVDSAPDRLDAEFRAVASKVARERTALARREVEWLTCEEVARRLGVCTETVLRWLRRGMDIEHQRIARTIRIAWPQDFKRHLNT